MSDVVHLLSRVVGCSQLISEALDLISMAAARGAQIFGCRQALFLEQAGRAWGCDAAGIGSAVAHGADECSCSSPNCFIAQLMSITMAIILPKLPDAPLQLCYAFPAQQDKNCQCVCKLTAPHWAAIRTAIAMNACHRQRPTSGAGQNMWIDDDFNSPACHTWQWCLCSGSAGWLHHATT